MVDDGTEKTGPQIPYMVKTRTKLEASGMGRAGDSQSSLEPFLSMEVNAKQGAIGILPPSNFSFQPKAKNPTEVIDPP